MTLRSAVKVTILVLVTVAGGGNQAWAQYFGSIRYIGAQITIPPTEIPPVPNYTVHNMMGGVNYVPVPVPQMPAPSANLAPTLPPGARQGVIDGQTYCYYQTRWYTPTLFGGSVYYQRVSPPYGAVVDSLPDGTRELTVGEATYFTVDGIYYQPVYSQGNVGYKIVAKPQGA